MTVADLLLTAAQSAGRERTVDDAVRAAWSTLHTEREFMGQAFRAWNRVVRGKDQEDIASLGAVICRAAHRDVEWVVTSLRDAAEVAPMVDELAEVDALAHARTERRDAVRRWREAEDRAADAQRRAEAALRLAHTLGATDDDVRAQITHDRRVRWAELRAQRWADLGFAAVRAVVHPPKRLRPGAAAFLGAHFEEDRDWVPASELRAALDSGRRRAAIDRELGATFDPDRDPTQEAE